MNTITMKVPNISCGHCIHTIKSEVGELAGVKSVDGDIQTKMVTVGFDDPATQEKIKALLADIDYPVES